MSTVNFFVKVGDTLPPLRARLKTAQGVAVDLTDLETAEIRFKPTFGSVFTRDGSVVGDPTAGLVEYEWAAEDFGVDADFAAGKYAMEIHLTFAGGSTLTVPSIGTATLNVQASLAS